MRKKTADTSKVESRRIITHSFSKMKPINRNREVHPSLGRRGIVVPYDIPQQEKCKCCGK